MPLMIDPNHPFPTLKNCLRPAVIDLWNGNRIVWTEAEGPLAAKLSPEEISRYARRFTDTSRPVDELWAGLIDTDDELRKAIGNPPGFMTDNITRERRFNQLERAGIDLGRGVLAAIHTIRACCYGWNGIVEARVADLEKQSTDPTFRQWLRVAWGDVARQEAVSAGRNTTLHEREQGRKTALEKMLGTKVQSKQDLLDIQALFDYALRPPAPKTPAPPLPPAPGGTTKPKSKGKPKATPAARPAPALPSTATPASAPATPPAAAPRPPRGRSTGSAATPAPDATPPSPPAGAERSGGGGRPPGT